MAKTGLHIGGRKKGSCSHKTFVQIVGLKTFLNVERPVTKRGSFYRLLQMPAPGEPGVRLLQSTKDFDNFYVCLNAALEADVLTDSVSFTDDCFADDRRTSNRAVSWRNLHHFRKQVFSWYHRDPWQEQPER